MIAATLGVPGETRAADFARLLEHGTKRVAWVQPAPGAIFTALVARPTGWQPGSAPSGRRALFHGQLHNRAELRRELALAEGEDAGLYAAALDRWGDQTDQRVIGHYCSIAWQLGEATLRLARSPIEAPPLHFRRWQGEVRASSHPRPLFWRDPAPRQVNLDRLARTMLVDFSDDFAGLWEHCGRMPQGCAIELGADGWREVWRYRLPTSPILKLPRGADYVEIAREMLDEAVLRVADGAQKPGVLLSGGLDSASVAASLAVQFPGRPIYGFTCGPEADWIAPPPHLAYYHEFPAVQKFAQMHPQLRVEYCGNEGLDFRHEQSELIRAMDCGTPSVGLGWAHHALHAKAREQGCDVLLTANWGNETFSNGAPWSFSEWLVRGQWRRLYRTLKERHGDPRPVWRKILSMAITPLLPRPLWQAAMRLSHGPKYPPLANCGLNPQWIAQHDLIGKARASGWDPGRIQFPSRRAFWDRIMGEDGQDREQYSQGMELLYGVPLRDPAAYRPLVELCATLPTELYHQPGCERWLAREMARGRLPEEQRLNREMGMHHVDWQRRIARAAPELRDELKRMADDSDIAALVDLPRLERLIDGIAEAEPGDFAVALPYITALPIGIAAGRFIAYAKGRNDI